METEHIDFSPDELEMLNEQRTFLSAVTDTIADARSTFEKRLAAEGPYPHPGYEFE